jgi:hypothetical protein
LYFGIFRTILQRQKIDETALSETKKIIEEVEDFQKEHGTLPEDVKEFTKAKRLRKNIRLGLLSTGIDFFEHEDAHFIEYHQSPFGPFFGYSFKPKSGMRLNNIDILIPYA